MAAPCWPRNGIRRPALPRPWLSSCGIAPDPATVSTLAPSPAWVGWDHAAEKLWPAPDDRDGDLNRHPGDRWLDEIGKAARRPYRRRTHQTEARERARLAGL
jgi:hypothetical protein